MAPVKADWDQVGEHRRLHALLARQTEYEKALGLVVTQNEENHRQSFVGYEAGGTFGWVPETEMANCAGPVVGLLRRYGRNGGQEPVLLVHGASAWRGTFFEPNGGLVRHLLGKRHDVWTLDWRGSKAITDVWRDKKSSAEVPSQITLMNLDSAAFFELPEAVAKVKEETTRRPAVFGHCMGAAIIAQAIARGWIGTQARFRKMKLNGTALRVDTDATIAPRVVLSAIGLFYRGGVDNWLRAQELFLVQPNSSFWCIDPKRTGWPDDFEKFFQTWEKLPYPHCDVSFCRRISSLIGSPYRPDDIDYLHHEDRLATQFGVLPVSLLNHCAQNVRRGWSAQMNAVPADCDDLKRAPFAALETTLITGSENQLWHRDSIDRMYEWLCRDPKVKAHKFVYDRYGHQDLWWDPRSAAPSGVYDRVSNALSERPFVR